jgi:hypothetical protein
MAIDSYKDLFEAMTAALTFLAAFGALWWRISKSAVKTSLVMRDMGTQLEKLTLASADLTKSFITLATKLDEREKDIVKLEGSIDTQRKDMIHLISALQQSSGSLNALWRTMQSLFPQDVPKRASDEHR